MKSYVTAALLALAAMCALPAAAGVVFSDGFESGVSGSVWEVVLGTYDKILVADGAHALGSGSAKQIDADPWIYYMRTRNPLWPVSISAGQSQVLTAYMWDDMWDVGANPVAGGVMLANGGLTDFFQISVNSNVSRTHYCWRTSKEGTFASNVARSQGWHKFQITVNPYTGAAGDAVFSIDDQIVAHGQRKGDIDLVYVRLGISLKTYQPFWYDNVTVTIVPEPASLLGLGAGLIGLLGLAKRRLLGRSAA
jgi:hypothetical protein